MDQFGARQALLAAALPFALTLSACAARAAAPHDATARPPVAVAIVRAEPAPDDALFRGPATVVAAHTYRLAFEVPGRVSAVNVDVGDRVAAGDVLATLDDAAYRDQAASASARMQEAAAQADRTENGSRPQERSQALAGIVQARAAVARAQAALALAEENDARTRALLAQGDVPAQQGDATHAALLDAQAQVAAARAGLSTAQQNASLVLVGPRNEDRSAAIAQASAMRADADLAATTLGKTVLRAPAGAFVETRDVEPGSLAEPGAEVLTLVDAGPPDIVVDVPETRLGTISRGTPATVVANGLRLAGRVTRIEPRADSASHAASVRIRAGGTRLAIGSVVDVTLGATRASGVSIDVGALLDDGGRTYVEVYVPGRHTVRIQQVEVRENAGDRAIVTGLAAGTPIVVMGEHEAHAGDPVRVVEP